MSRDAVSWDHYRAFLAVAQTGSLSAAARQIGQTQPARLWQSQRSWPWHSRTTRFHRSGSG